MSFLQILLFIAALLASTVVMVTYMLLGFLGSAAFGKHLRSRILSRVGAGVMLAVLAIEFWLYQCVARPTTPWAIAGAFLVMMVLWSFLKTAFTDPGTDDCPEWKAWSRSHSSLSNAAQPNKLSEVQDAQAQRRRTVKHWAPGETEACDHCECIRPERAHHCRHCDRCILRMDHHCPLIGNCVGWRNHKYYILLQFWQFWACVVFLLSPGSPGEHAMYGGVDGVRMQLLLYVGVMWAILIMLIAAKSLTTSVLMAARNETHVETNFIGRNPYKLEPLGNLTQLLGPVSICMLLPVETDRQCSGTNFPVFDDVPGKDEICTGKTILQANITVTAKSYGSV